MKIRLQACGPKKIAVIKEIRTAYRCSLRDAKDWATKAPVDLPDLDVVHGRELVRGLKEAGATVAATSGASAIDRLTASSYISTASIALGEGNLRDTRLSLRAALRLLGDMVEFCDIDDIDDA